MQVMTLLDNIYTWQRSTDSSSSSPDAAAAAAAADPAGVRQLLLGCAELLRPAANCSVEWRCAALALMSGAAEGFMDSCPGELDVCLGVIYLAVLPQLLVKCNVITAHTADGAVSFKAVVCGSYTAPRLMALGLWAFT
jgi:hypothetical protein